MDTKSKAYTEPWFFEDWFESYTPDNKEREQCMDAWHDGRRQGRKAADKEIARLEAQIKAAKAYGEESEAPFYKMMQELNK